MFPLKFGSLAKIHSSSPHGTCENTPPSRSKALTIYPRFRALPELGYFGLKTSPGDRRLLTGLSLYELEIYTGRDTLGLHFYTRCVFEIQTGFLRSLCFLLQEILLRGRFRGSRPTSRTIVLSLILLQLDDVVAPQRVQARYLTAIVPLFRPPVGSLWSTESSFRGNDFHRNDEGSAQTPTPIQCQIDTQ